MKPQGRAASHNRRIIAQNGEYDTPSPLVNSLKKSKREASARRGSAISSNASFAASNNAKLRKILVPRKMPTKVLTPQQKKIVSAVGAGNSTVLHVAAEGSSAEMVRYLCDCGVNLHARDTNLATPLHRAAERGNLPAVVCLLEYGADKKARNSNGETAEDIASRLGNTELLTVLQQMEVEQ